ncbi:MAG: V-type ATPase subunit [Treponema sp.]|uniref:V0D/AC39 family V-type ATPase subunit n=1 Tax=Treponema sp. TaxID=166 RepID=UPI001B404A2D|nr:V-type ATPase subunit [Treponema sp.]MBP5401734.1 V-type ATPase subunit [Treponema sp.]MBR5932537.1 V-type ATPase subunit [Treponema sp.]
MDRTGASCYVYAKASGMLAKSFTGQKSSILYSVKSLPELWGLLFKDEVPSVPQTVLAQLIEKKAAAKFIYEFKKLLETYTKPDKVLINLLHWFDYENLKTAAAYLSTGRSEKPDFFDISPFNILDYSQWPDLKKMTAENELQWYNKIPGVDEQQWLSHKLDIQFVNELLDSADKLSLFERNAVKKLIIKRYSMKNVIWVMRLKVYYNMKKEDIIKQIAYLDESKGDKDLFAQEALKIIDYDINTYEQWSKWKYSSLINGVEEAKIWKLDPKVVEERVAEDFFISVKRAFHKYPFTAMVLVSWFFIKQNELDNIRTVTEAVRLNVQLENVV